MILSRTPFNPFEIPTSSSPGEAVRSSNTRISRLGNNLLCVTFADADELIFPVDTWYSVSDGCGNISYIRDGTLTAPRVVSKSSTGTLSADRELVVSPNSDGGLVLIMLPVAEFGNGEPNY